MLRAEGVKHWIDFGTLLGAVREGGFLDTDVDFDICLLKPDDDQLLALKDKISAKTNILLISHSLIRGCPRHDALVTGSDPRAVRSCTQAGLIYMDFYAWERRDRDVVPILPKLKSYSFKYYFIDELEEITFEGYPFPAPRHRLDLLMHRYGPNWRTPMPKQEFFKIQYECIQPFERKTTAYVPMNMNVLPNGQGEILDRGKHLFDRVLVGVHFEDHSQLNALPGDLKEKLSAITACRFVDGVIADPPPMITLEFMRRNQIDYILSGRRVDLLPAMEAAIRTEKLHVLSDVS